VRLIKVLKAIQPHEVKDNPELKYWVRVVGTYIGFKNESEYRTWINNVRDLVEVVAYK
jgi:hypothetical protein